MSRAAVDETVLAEIVRRLVEAVDPDRIILFGSRVRGEERPDSDVDLMIIKASDDPSQGGRSPPIRCWAASAFRRTSCGTRRKRWRTGPGYGITSSPGPCERAGCFMKSGLDHARELLRRATARGASMSLAEQIGR